MDFPLMRRKQGGKYGRTGSAPKEKRPEISGLFVPLHFCFSLAVLSSFLLVQLQSVAFLLGHALFFMHPLFLSCARCLLLLSSFFALLCPALLSFRSSFFLFLSYSLTLSFSSLFSLSCPPPLRLSASGLVFARWRKGGDSNP